MEHLLASENYQQEMDGCWHQCGKSCTGTCDGSCDNQCPGNCWKQGGT